MQFSFDEAGAEKSVNVFDLDENGVSNFKQIKLTSPKNLIRLQANCAADGVKLLNENGGCYVELTLNLKEPLTPAESAALHCSENLAALKADVAFNRSEVKVSNKNKSSSQLFTEFYKSRYDSQPSDDLLSLFLSLTEEE